MLKIWQGYYTEEGVTVDKPDEYFDVYFDKKNFLTDFSRRVVKDCGRATVIADNVFEHEYRGTHPASCLATGVKTVLLARYNPEVIVNLVYCGDNCIPYIIEASKDRDIVVVGQRLIDFYDYELYGVEVDKIYVMNNNTLYEDDSCCIDTWFKYGKDWNECVDGKIVCHKNYFGV